ncbi:hypothetical protein QBC39DRAFT_407070 [Podospora conica]|nr:hypothetical protein QBC39DRAFT_407070 [Schizothecium conicum]
MDNTNTNTQNNNNKNNKDDRSKRSGNPRNFSRSSSRSSGSSGAPGHAGGRGMFGASGHAGGRGRQRASGHAGGRGHQGASGHAGGRGRGQSRGGGISRSDPYRPSQPSRLSEVIQSHDIGFFDRPGSGTDNRSLNNQGTVINTGCIIIAPPGEANIAKLLDGMSSLPSKITGKLPGKITGKTTSKLPGKITGKTTGKLPGKPALSATSKLASNKPAHGTCRRRNMNPIAGSARRPSKGPREVGPVTTALRPQAQINGWRNYKRFEKCGNCDTKGHSVMDCLIAKTHGFIEACPICNMDNHVIDDCSYRHNIDWFEELIKNRGNKPPIFTRRDWCKLWVDKCRPMMPLPWSIDFSLRVATSDSPTLAALGTFDPKTWKIRNPCDPSAEVSVLPMDPCTAVAMQPATVSGLKLPPQIAPARKSKRDAERQVDAMDLDTDQPPRPPPGLGTNNGVPVPGGLGDVAHHSVSGHLETMHSDSPQKHGLLALRDLISAYRTGTPLM